MKYDMLRELTFLREDKRKDPASEKPFYPMKGVTPLNTQWRTLNKANTKMDPATFDPSKPEEKVEGVMWELKLDKLNEPVKTMMEEWAVQLKKLKEQENTIKNIKPNLEQAGYDMASSIFGKNIIHPMYMRIEVNTGKFIDVILAKQEKKEKIEKVNFEGAYKSLLTMGAITQETYDEVLKAFTSLEDARPSPKSIDIELPKTEAFDGILGQFMKIKRWLMSKFEMFKTKDREFQNALRKI